MYLACFMTNLAAFAPPRQHHSPMPPPNNWSAPPDWNWDDIYSEARRLAAIPEPSVGWRSERSDAAFLEIEKEFKRSLPMMTEVPITDAFEFTTYLQDIEDIKGMLQVSMPHM